MVGKYIRVAITLGNESKYFSPGFLAEVLPK